MSMLHIIIFFLIYFLFINAKTSPKGGFAKWLKDFLTFKILWIKPVLKIAYCIATIRISVYYRPLKITNITNSVTIMRISM